MDKFGFIKKFESKIKPLLDKEDRVRIDEDKLSTEEVESVLEKFETKILTYVNPDSSADAKQVLLEGSEPASLNVLKPLIEQLKEDKLCGGITLVVDSVTGQKLMESDTLAQERSPEDPVLSDIQTDMDSALVFLEEMPDSPRQTLMHSAKSVYGAEKLYIHATGQFFTSQMIEMFSKDNREAMDEIDAILTGSQSGKEMIAEIFDFPEDKIIVVGDSTIDSIQQHPKEVLRAIGREKLGVDEDAIVLLYSGFPSSDESYSELDPQINEKTFTETIEGAIQAATDNSEKQFVVIARSHPRDPNGHKMLEDIPVHIPSNLTITPGLNLSFEEAVYAADGTACISLSVESYLSPYRGRHTIICAYEGEGLSGEIVEKQTPPAVTKQRTLTKGTVIAHSAETIAKYLKDMRPFEPVKKPNEKPAITNITQLLLANVDGKSSDKSVSKLNKLV